MAVRTRNARLTAIRSFFRFAAYEMPMHSAQIERVLAMPTKRFDRKLISFLTRAEVDALLSAPDRATWTGRRDYALLLTTLQTGLRLSEATALRPRDVTFGAGAHVEILGKGRKQQVVPLLQACRQHPSSLARRGRRRPDDFVFPSTRRGRLSPDAVAGLLKKHVEVAGRTCASLAQTSPSTACATRQPWTCSTPASNRRSSRCGWDTSPIETTHVYLDADLALREQILAKTIPFDGKPGKFKPDDKLLAFLNRQL